MDCLKCGACCFLLSLPACGRFDKDWLNARRISIDKGKAFVFSPCQYLDLETKECKIYPTRPLSCKYYPVGSKDCLDCRRVAGIKE